MFSTARAILQRRITPAVRGGSSSGSSSSTGRRTWAPSSLLQPWKLILGFVVCALLLSSYNLSLKGSKDSKHMSEALASVPDRPGGTEQLELEVEKHRRTSATHSISPGVEDFHLAMDLPQAGGNTTYTHVEDVSQRATAHDTSALHFTTASPRHWLCSAIERKLAVYVYDMPRKFNFGILNITGLKKRDQRKRGDGAEAWPVDASSMLPWPHDAPIPAWPWSIRRKWATAQQHSVEYFLAADLMSSPKTRHANMSAVRVFDPAKADVFFVPVFASLMTIRLRRRHYQVYERLSKEVALFLSESRWWRRHHGRDHVIPLTHPHALEPVRKWLSGAVFMVVDFARYSPTEGNINKDIVSPYTNLVAPYSVAQEQADLQRWQQQQALGEKGGRRQQGRSGVGRRLAADDDREDGEEGEEEREGEGDERVPAAETSALETSNSKSSSGGLGGGGGGAVDPFDMRHTLLFFQGSIAGRKRRQQLFRALRGEADVHIEDVRGSGDSINQTEQGMRRSKFCLHLVGDTPSASRFFNAIASGCVPVVISDGLDLPFESAIDYSEFVVDVSEADAMEKGYVVKLLRSITREKWHTMQQRLRANMHHFSFQHPAQPGDAVDMLWQQVREKLPNIGLQEHRDKRLTIPDWWMQ